MKNFLIMTNEVKDPGFAASNRIKDYLEARGGKAVLREDFTEDTQTYSNIPEDAECVIVLGGDGTMLHASRLIAPHDLPVVGVNLGTLGFLTEIEMSHLSEGLDDLLSDRFHIEERMMLEGCIFHRDISCYRLSALNDIVITRSGFSRIISFKIIVNGELLDVYAADGVIISTPTGSTGYNLSAGGPIVNPEANVILITPVCPHSLQAKSIVLGEWDTIEIHIQKVRKTQLEEALVTFDGQVAERLNPGDIIKINKSRKVAKVVKVQEKSFYHTLRAKVGGKA
ncbi:NAD(+)/NADH kinase [Anaerostipes sp.]|uniref:NAD(+)/NADH kinase n=1 Tax=Anaerostipes sp. TaxID=1872530 RepID=UPI0025BC9409|nr:NAD(+)/NADH kinase [Anaerostipes sp.]MBS7008015.1 NAD(+)/NADH kinase [Anaerostipes sp.]